LIANKKNEKIKMSVGKEVRKGREVIVE